MEPEIIRLKRILTRKKEELLIDTNNDLYVSKLKFQIRELERMTEIIMEKDIEILTQRQRWINL